MSKEIPLTQGHCALVDARDYERLSEYSWYFDGGYARRSPPWKQRGRGKAGRPILMHRAVLDAPDGLEVDHINGNGLDNRRANLRLATKTTNQHNRKPNATQNGRPTSSAYKGVGWQKRRGRWYASLQVNGTRLHLGYYTEEVEAARAYDEAAVEFHGEFCRLNFPHAVEAAEGIENARKRLCPSAYPTDSRRSEDS